MQRMKIKIKKLNDAVPTPEYKTEGSVGFDFVADKTGWKNGQFIVYTGVAVEIPKGYAMFLFPRSSTGTETDLRLSNSVGVIDSDYRGEIKAVFDINGMFDLNKIVGRRLIQGVIVPIMNVEFEEVEELSETVRGDKGYGSTGK